MVTNKKTMSEHVRFLTFSSTTAHVESMPEGQVRAFVKAQVLPPERLVSDIQATQKPLDTTVLLGC